MNSEQDTNVQTENETISISAFLENIPPNQLKTINDLAIYRNSRTLKGWCDFFFGARNSVALPSRNLQWDKIFSIL